MTRLRPVLLAAALLPFAARAEPPAHPAPAHPPTHHAPAHGTKHPAAHAPVPAHPATPDAAPPTPSSPAAPEVPAKGNSTGLPLPRFVALRSDDVDLRVGPGTRYPIQWVYKRRDLPVEILREFEVWRLVVDSDGVKGWVHQATLTGRRSVLVTGKDEAVLRAASDDAAAAVARLKPGVVGRLRGCEAASEWCQVQVGDLRGWLRRNAVWGLLPNEAVQP